MYIYIHTHSFTHTQIHISLPILFNTYRHIYEENISVSMRRHAYPEEQVPGRNPEQTLTEPKEWTFTELA